MYAVVPTRRMRARPGATWTAQLKSAKCRYPERREARPLSIPTHGLATSTGMGVGFMACTLLSQGAPDESKMRLSGLTSLARFRPPCVTVRHRA